MTNKRELIEKILESNNTESYLIDIAENLLDSFIVDGLFKEIPLIETMRQFKNLRKSINDALFTRKLLGVLKNCGPLTDDERKSFIEKYSEKTRKEFFHNLILAVEKIDDYDKAPIIGRLFLAVLKQDIKTADWKSVVHSLLRFNMYHLNTFKTFYLFGNTWPNDEALSELQSCGFAVNGRRDNHTGTTAGNLLIKHGFVFKHPDYHNILCNHLFHNGFVLNPELEKEEREDSERVKTFSKDEVIEFIKSINFDEVETHQVKCMRSKIHLHDPSHKDTIENRLLWSLECLEGKRYQKTDCSSNWKNK